MLGQYIRTNVHRWTPDRRQLVFQLLSAGLLPLLGTIALFTRKALFFRWGSMSMAYFVASAAVIPLLYVSSAFIAAKNETLKSALSLRGFRSLAVVPIHYLLILLAKQLPQMSYATCFALSLLYTVMSFKLAAMLERYAKRIKPGTINLSVWTAVAGGTLLFICLRFGAERTFVSDTIRHSLQIGLCLLLIAPLPSYSQPQHRAA